MDPAKSVSSSILFFAASAEPKSTSNAVSRFCVSISAFSGITTAPVNPAPRPSKPANELNTPIILRNGDVTLSTTDMPIDIVLPAKPLTESKRRPILFCALSALLDVCSKEVPNRSLDPTALSILPLVF